jgi:hypothetical protein
MLVSIEVGVFKTKESAIEIEIEGSAATVVANTTRIRSVHFGKNSGRGEKR